MKYIVSIICYLLSWILFLVGDLVSKVMHLTEDLGHLYPLYNKLMIWSVNVQDFAGNKSPWSPWEDIDE